MPDFSIIMLIVAILNVIFLSVVVPCKKIFIELGADKFCRCDSEARTETTEIFFGGEKRTNKLEKKHLLKFKIFFNLKSVCCECHCEF